MLQAALAGGTADRRSVFELFPRRLPEGRRYGVVAGVGRALDAIEGFRFDDEVLAALDGRRRRADARLAVRLPLLRRRLGLPRGRGLLPLLPAADGRGELRRGGAAGDAAALDLQPRLGDRLGGVPDDLRRRRPAVHRDGLAAHPRGGGGRGRAGGVRRRLRRPPPTSRPGSGTACRPPAPARTASRCCTTPRRTPSGPRSTSLGAGTTLLVDTYDVAEAVRLGVEVAGTGLGAVRLDSGDLGAARPAGARAARRARARTSTRIVVTCDLDEHAIAALAAAPVDGYGVGTSLVTGSGHPTCGFVYKLVAREGDDGELQSSRRRARTRSRSAGASTRCAGVDRAGVAEAEVIGIGAPPDERRRRPRRCWSPLVARRRGGRPRDARGGPRAAPAPRAELPLAARQLSRGEPVIPTVLEGGAALMALSACDFFSECSMRGTTMTVVLPAGQRGADRSRIDQPASTDLPPGAVPAARALRRRDRVAAVLLHRAVRHRARPRRGDAAGGPQLLRRRGARPPLLGWFVRGAAPRGRPFFRVSDRARTPSWPACPWAATARSRWALHQPERFAAAAIAVGRARPGGAGRGAAGRALSTGSSTASRAGRRRPVRAARGGGPARCRRCTSGAAPRTRC